MNPITHDASPLLLSQNQAAKLMCCLSWDPNEDSGIGDSINAALGRNTGTYDLDLSCYCYDENKSLMDFVTGEDGEMVDRSGLIKHTGDCVDGEVEGDDEAIEMDLGSLPDYIQHIVFLVEVGSAHSFADVAVPLVRIADGLSNESLASHDINEGAGKDYSACVYATLSRRSNTDWVLSRYHHYLDHEDIESWPNFLSQFIAD